MPIAKRLGKIIAFGAATCVVLIVLLLGAWFALGAFARWRYPDAYDFVPIPEGFDTCSRDQNSLAAHAVTPPGSLSLCLTNAATGASITSYLISSEPHALNDGEHTAPHAYVCRRIIDGHAVASISYVLRGLFVEDMELVNADGRRDAILSIEPGAHASASQRRAVDAIAAAEFNNFRGVVSQIPVYTPTFWTGLSMKPASSAECAIR